MTNPGERNGKDVSSLLRAWSDGDQSALKGLTPIVYEELRRLAHYYMERERPGHSLQTTALVNEAYLRLVDYKRMKWQNRAHFFAVSSQVMRRILVDYARRRNDSAFFNWRGMDPTLVPAVVQRAHAAGLRVGAHVDTRGDFHNALVGGVDEILHIPGFRGDERTQLADTAPYEITEADAKLAAARGVVVVTTEGGALGFDPRGTDSTRRRQFDALATRNLRVLRAAGVRLALGSDTYRDDSVLEAEYLATLGVFTPLELLRLWSEATPRAIYPQRRVGCLDDGCEASFLALSANPTMDFANTKRIALRMKDGRLLP